jgi:hypothetical protein
VTSLVVFQKINLITMKIINNIKYENQNKLLIERLINKYSILYCPIYKIYSSMRYKSLKKCNDYTYINVDINDIRGRLRGNRWKSVSCPNQVVGDIYERRAEYMNIIDKSTSKYIKLYQRYILGYDWMDTDIFKNKYVKLLNNGYTIYDRSNIKEIVKYYENYYDKLWLDIKINGLRTPSKNINPMYIYISKNGDIFYTVDGNHRLYIADMLGINVIPVVVLARHKEWVIRLEKIIKNKYCDDVIYQKHPDVKRILNE